MTWLVNRRCFGYASQLGPTDKVHNLYLILFVKNSCQPKDSPHDIPVEFNRDLFRSEVQI